MSTLHVTLILFIFTCMLFYWGVILALLKLITTLPKESDKSIWGYEIYFGILLGSVIIDLRSAKINSHFIFYDLIISRQLNLELDLSNPNIGADNPNQRFLICCSCD